MSFCQSPFSHQYLVTLTAIGLSCSPNGPSTWIVTSCIGHRENSSSLIMQRLSDFISQYQKVPFINITTHIIRNAFLYVSESSQAHGDRCTFSKLHIFPGKLEFYHWQQNWVVFPEVTGSFCSLLRKCLPCRHVWITVGQIFQTKMMFSEKRSQRSFVQSLFPRDGHWT